MPPVPQRRDVWFQFKGSVRGVMRVRTTTVTTRLWMMCPAFKSLSGDDHRTTHTSQGHPDLEALTEGGGTSQVRIVWFIAVLSSSCVVCFQGVLATCRTTLSVRA